MSAGGAEQVADEMAALSRALCERLAAADVPDGYQAACAEALGQSPEDLIDSLTRPLMTP